VIDWSDAAPLGLSTCPISLAVFPFPKLWDAPRNQQSADQAGQASRPYGELRSPDGGRDTRFPVAQPVARDGGGKERARKSTLEVIRGSPLQNRHPKNRSEDI
jgi:hypothetical protein